MEGDTLPGGACSAAKGIPPAGGVPVGVAAKRRLRALFPDAAPRAHPVPAAAPLAPAPAGLGAWQARARR